MALTIISAAEPVVVSNLKIVLYGEPNIGKTSLAMSFPKPFLLDFDGGAQRGIRSGSDVVARVQTWDDVMEAVSVTKDFAEYHTIVIDTVSKCLDMIGADIMLKDSRMGYGGALTQKGWGILGNRFNQFLHKLVTTGKDVVMLAQAREQDNGDSKQIRIKASGASQGIIQEAADLMGYLHSVNNERVASFTLCDQYFAKDVKNTMGRVVLPDPSVHKDTGTKMLTQMKSAFTLAAEAEAKTIQIVQEWQDTISGFTTPDEFNTILPQFTAMTGTLKAQVGAIIKQRRELLGIEYASDRGFFIKTVAPAPVAETPQPQAEPTPAPTPVQNAQPAMMEF